MRCLYAESLLATLYYVHRVAARHVSIVSQAEFLPQSISIGRDISLDFQTPAPFKLRPCSSVATVDYGVERSGFFFFEVSALSAPAQIEVKYGEQYDALINPLADGPYTFQTQLSNSFRVETYNVTSTGRFRAPLLQGGQRWQSIRLISGDGITFKRVGLEPTAQTTNVLDLPGKFNSSNNKLNEIWKLGAVAATVACVEKGTQSAVWEIDPDKGVYLRSLRPALSIQGGFLENYTLEFDGNIDRSGLWWSTSRQFGRFGGIQLLLVSELPETTTFNNTNRTLFTPNSVMLSWGYDFVNQTTLPSYFLDRFEVPFTVKENTWYRLSTVLSPNGYLSVSIDNQQIFNVSMAAYYTGPPGPFAGSYSSFIGSFGFGAWQDHSAYVRNVTVKTANGTTVYTNKMSSPDILTEYGTGPNVQSVCLDGPKRDRLVWLGDFYHTTRIVPVSTNRNDLVQGTFRMFLDSQLDNGEFNISPTMGYDPTVQAVWAPDGSFGLSDYQLLGMSSLYSFVRSTNDVEFVKSTWPQWVKQLEWLVDKINTTGDGLWYAPSAFLGPSAGGSAVSCAALQALREFAEISTAVGDDASYARATVVADQLQTAINAQLWNDEKGFFSLSPVDKNDFSVAAIAFCITSGAASASQQSRLISSLSQLALGPGYRDSSVVDPSDPFINISPNTNGFLLQALFQAGAFHLGYSLINSLWGTMISNPHTASGASWEYTDVHGNPGLGLFTSLSHPWGGAATYILTEWVAGIRTADGVDGFGHANWIMDPQAGIKLGLERASATVPSAQGVISVAWEVLASKLYVSIQAPKNTSGTFMYRDEQRMLTGSTDYSFTVEL